MLLCFSSAIFLINLGQTHITDKRIVFFQRLFLLRNLSTKSLIAEFEYLFQGAKYTIKCKNNSNFAKCLNI